MKKTEKQKDKLFVSRWQKKNGKLVFVKGTDASLFQALTDGLREGCFVDWMADFADDNGSLGQIAKLKAGTREIAKESGHVFIEVEQQIKKRAGLYDEQLDVYKSFGNCSQEQLESAIHVMISIGETIGLNLH